MSGIPNFGNTCYISTCLQCLRYCKRFRAFTEHFTESQPSQLMTLLDRFYGMLESTDSDPAKISRVANALMMMISRRMKNLETGEQEDVHEFFITLVDVLSKESSMCYADQVPIRHVIQGPFDPRLEKVIRFMDKQFYTDKPTFIENLFRGQHAIVMTCQSCNHTRVGSDVFTSIQLHPISSSLVECLRNSLQEEVVEGVECEQCRSKTKHAKMTRIFRSPKVLMLVANADRRSLTDVPEVMNARACLWKDVCDSSPIYRLKAVACHVGSRRSGHYAAVCKDPNMGWTLYDDSTVKPLDTPSTYVQHGYLFVYEQDEK